MQLSTHFSLSEMLRSDAATRLGIDEQFTPSQEIINNLTSLCRNILEPLRDTLGKPLLITSGYRCARLNKLIGGAETSQHCNGQAADYHVEGMTIMELYHFVKVSTIAYDQIIEEFDQWVHTSWAANPRRSMLIAKKVNGITTYTPDK